MIEFFTALKYFVSAVLIDKGEYNFRSKKFNPVKVMINFILIGNLWFTGFLLTKLYHIQQVIEVNCPSIFKIESDVFHNRPNTVRDKK